MEVNDKYNLLRSFGSTVRTRRKELKLSQEELAARAGLNRTYIGDIERGARNIALVNIALLASALETKPSSLLMSAEKRAYRKGSR